MAYFQSVIHLQLLKIVCFSRPGLGKGGMTAILSPALRGRLSEIIRERRAALRDQSSYVQPGLGHLYLNSNSYSRHEMTSYQVQPYCTFLRKVISFLKHHCLRKLPDGFKPPCSWQHHAWIHGATSWEELGEPPGQPRTLQAFRAWRQSTTCGFSVLIRKPCAVRSILVA